VKGIIIVAETSTTYTLYQKDYMKAQKIHIERVEIDTFRPVVNVLSDARRKQLFGEMYEKLGINPERFKPEYLAGGLKYLATLPQK